MNTWAGDDAERNDHLPAAPGAMLTGRDGSYVPVGRDACQCERPAGRARWALMVIHSGAPRCPECGGTWPEPAPVPARHPWRALGRHLAYPFRREAGTMMQLWCVACEARAERDGKGDVREASHVIDGMSVCEDDARPMLRILAGRLPERDEEARG